MCVSTPTQLVESYCTRRSQPRNKQWERTFTNRTLTIPKMRIHTSGYKFQSGTVHIPLKTKVPKYILHMYLIMLRSCTIPYRKPFNIAASSTTSFLKDCHLFVNSSLHYSMQFSSNTQIRNAETLPTFTFTTELDCSNCPSGHLLSHLSHCIHWTCFYHSYLCLCLSASLRKWQMQSQFAENQISLSYNVNTLFDETMTTNDIYFYPTLSFDHRII